MIVGASFTESFPRLPGRWSIMAVTVVAGLTEGFGMTLFIPLLQSLSGSTSLEGLPGRLSALLPRGDPAVMAGLMVGLIVLAYGVALLRDIMLARAKHGFVGHLRTSVLNSLFRSDWAYLAQQAGGEVINRLLAECQRAAYAVTFQVQLVAVAVQALLLIGVGALVEWRLLAVAGLLGPVMLLLVRPLVRRSAGIGQRIDDATRNYSFHVVDYLRCAKLVRVTGAEEPVLERMACFNREACDANVSGEFNLAFSYFISRALPVVMVGLIIALAGSLIPVDAITLLGFLLIMSRVAPLLVQVQQHYQAYAGYRPALDVVDAALAESERHVEPAPSPAKAPARLTSEIAFRQVGYTYPGADLPALREIDVVVPRYATIAIVGGSGGGKSTLVDLLAGIRLPDQGMVNLDGVDLREFDRLSWRRRIGYVTQDVTIFNDTLRNNLTFGRHDIGDDDLGWALERAQLSGVVASLPDGLETMLGEAGTRFSGGQRQRVALARALAGRPDLLLLDEATSALDAEAEAMVQEALEGLAHQLTIVVVAHRLATIRKADLICVLEAGRVVEAGSFEQLRGAEGRFAQLCELQRL